jgi:hypothetical protein
MPAILARAASLVDGYYAPNPRRDGSFPVATSVFVEVQAAKAFVIGRPLRW